MSLTAGTLSQVSVGSTTASLVATAATGGTGPYLEQWYRSTNPSFSPGGGTLIAGATSLTFNDTGLIPGTAYTYKVVYTDTGNSNVTVNSTGLAVATSSPVLSPNQFAQTSLLGMVDQQFDYNTHAVQIDISQATPVFFGAAVKLIASSSGPGGVPKVVACTADTDQVFGFINFDIKTVQYTAGSRAEVSCGGNYIYLYATGAISCGQRVTLDLTTNGGVVAATGSSATTIVGFAYDTATAAGQLIRVGLQTPSYLLDS